ncbi:hypothetical protein SYNPS1DRAFT_30052 [Syncephalis pseudoplumigaleata]|uniref:Uncharacterized protein n=1 Tax=Syncephalis pseudoplumigaleata TaxID=1712513 RepID=A0A4P9YXC8_9FUNG|nr:hypothetical protein SYNPS1DRAFT_30052 [Syncephalis pseudoplumigaleata]|eukprot:RKP24182.1 hypothetical protein SYNPS1DRAFT_30052 [Syncephalis pseudoplumigaleata]
MRLAPSLFTAAAVAIVLMDAVASATPMESSSILHRFSKYAEWMPVDKEAAFGDNKFSITKTIRKSGAVDYLRGKLNGRAVTITCIPKPDQQQPPQNMVTSIYKKLKSTKAAKLPDVEEYVAHYIGEYEAPGKLCYVSTASCVMSLKEAFKHPDMKNLEVISTAADKFIRKIESASCSGSIPAT